MKLKEAVCTNPEVMSGTLCFRGTRVPVSTLFAHLRAGDLDEFFLGFPNVSREMVEAVLNSSEELLNLHVTREIAA